MALTLFEDDDDVFPEQVKSLMEGGDLAHLTPLQHVWPYGLQDLKFSITLIIHQRNLPLSKLLPGVKINT